MRGRNQAVRIQEINNTRVGLERTSARQIKQTRAPLAPSRMYTEGSEPAGRTVS
jgi:hypothetical protein